MENLKYFLLVLFWFQCYCEKNNNGISSIFGRSNNYTKKSTETWKSKRDTFWKNKGQGGKLTEQDVIERILTDYNWRIRPKGLNSTFNPQTGGPIVVVVNIMLRTISKIDDVNMEYSAQFTFREEWHDPRLAYQKYGEIDHLPFVVLAPSQKIWMPDTFFQNEKIARKHDIDKPNVLIRIYPNGKILYSVRLSMVLSCPMDLSNYPLDNQTCFIDLSSYTYMTSDIRYMWKTEEPVQKKAGLEKSLPSFKLVRVDVEYCTSITTRGESSCLRTVLLLRRQYSFYLIQLYMPSFLLVIMSWVNFWIDKESVPARVILGITTLLTMITQASGINSKLPPVSYTKAVDVWIGVCLTFIFGALIEYALVNYAGRVEFMEKERKKKSLASDSAATAVPHVVPVHSRVTVASSIDIHRRAKSVSSDPSCSLCDEEQQISRMEPQITENPLDAPESSAAAKRKVRPNKTNRFRVWLSRHKERSKRVDVISRFVFPCLFLFFNCGYWTYYLSQPHL